MKYKITIEEISEYEETIRRYRSKIDPKKSVGSLYSINEEDRENYEEYKYPTGKMQQDSEKIFEQTVNSLAINTVIKSINQM